MGQRSLKQLAFKQPLEELVSEVLVIGTEAGGADGGSVSWFHGRWLVGAAWLPGALKASCITFFSQTGSSRWICRKKKEFEKNFGGQTSTWPGLANLSPAF
jgi:hypothetical protein